MAFKNFIISIMILMNACSEQVSKTDDGEAQKSTSGESGAGEMELDAGSPISLCPSDFKFKTGKAEHFYLSWPASAKFIPVGGKIDIVPPSSSVAPSAGDLKAILCGSSNRRMKLNPKHEAFIGVSDKTFMDPVSGSISPKLPNKIGTHATLSKGKGSWTARVCLADGTMEGRALCGVVSKPSSKNECNGISMSQCGPHLQMSCRAAFVANAVCMDAHGSNYIDCNSREVLQPVCN